MLKFAISILFCGVTGALGAAVPDGMVPLFDDRIVGGYLATIEQFPWQVSLQRDGSHFCGGSLYSSTIVITAAHCVPYEAAGGLWVRAGSTYWGAGGGMRKVDAIEIHPNYNANTQRADCAVLLLHAAFPLNNVNMQAIPLATSPPDDDASARASGWGSLESGGWCCPSQLRGVYLKIVNNAHCGSSAYGYGNEILDGMICATGPGKDSCQGDSGGPLTSGGVLAGIVSWGYGCADEHYPGVYTSVSYYRNWLVVTANSIGS